MSLATIDVRDLVGAPGSSREQQLRGTVEGLGSELARVAEDSPIDAELLLESVVEGIFVSGTLTGTLRLRCARCLVDFERPFAVEVRELFSAAPDDDGDEYPFGPDAGLDPEQMVRDAVGVGLPFSPLCRPDCLGLCEVCGGDRNLGECPGHEQVDPRFAVLSELLADLPSDLPAMPESQPAPGDPDHPLDEPER